MPGGEISVSAGGECGRAWTFKTEEEADEFVDLVTRKVPRSSTPPRTRRSPTTTRPALADADGRTVDGFETTFAVNHLAQYLLLRGPPAAPSQVRRSGSARRRSRRTSPGSPSVSIEPLPAIVAIAPPIDRKSAARARL
jgi:hypothetical protein